MGAGGKCVATCTLGLFVVPRPRDEPPDPNAPGKAHRNHHSSEIHRLLPTLPSPTSRLSRIDVFSSTDVTTTCGDFLNRAAPRGDSSTSSLPPRRAEQAECSFGE